MASPVVDDGGGGGGGMEAAVTVALPEYPGTAAVTYCGLQRHVVRIGDADVKVYYCPDTGSVYGKMQDIIATQAGKLVAAARLVEMADGWAWQLPYDIVAIKQESKDAVIAKRLARLKKGYDCDDAFLDKAIVAMLAADDAVRPYVPTVRELWHDAKVMYTVCDYYPADLRTLIASGTGGAARGPLTEAVTRSLMSHVGVALAALHARGYCHRDISPENIMVRGTGAAGDPQVAVLIDYGTAARLTRAAPPAAGAAAARATSMGLAEVSVDDDDMAITFGVELAAAAASGSSAAGGGGGVAGGSGGGGALPLPLAPPTLRGVSSCSALSASPVGGAPPLPTTVGGFLPLPPPPPSGTYCKARYADPAYLAGKPYWGVAFDLWSLGQTIFACVQGEELYHRPNGGVDGVFHVIEQHEAALTERGGSGSVAPPTSAASARPGVSPVAAAPSPARHASAFPHDAARAAAAAAAGTPRIVATPLAEYLAAVSSRRVAGGLPPLSDALVDLLLRTFRLRPDFRPLSVESFLAHPWFTGDPIHPAPWILPGRAASFSAGAAAALAAAPAASPHLAAGDVSMGDGAGRPASWPAAGAAAAAAVPFGRQPTNARMDES